MTIVVTGSASGIGAACRSRFEAEGQRVIGVDLRDAEVVADLATRSGRHDAVRRVAELCPEGLSGVVTCAGVGPLPSRSAELLVSLNHFGTVEVLAGLRPLLTADSAAVAISSNSTTCQPGVPAALVDACLAGDEEAARDLAAGIPTMDGVYPATKTAVARWVRRQAVTSDWIGAGIRLNAIAPGLIETAMTTEMRADATVGPLLELFPIPLGRGGRADEVASLVAWLLGPESSLLVGSLVVADGGTDALLRPDAQPAPWVL